MVNSSNLRTKMVVVGWLLLMAVGIAYAVQIQRDDVGGIVAIGRVQTAQETILLYSQITQATGDLTVLKFGTGDVDAFGFFVRPREVSFWAANAGGVAFSITVEATDVVLRRPGTGDTALAADALSLRMGPPNGKLLPRPDHATLIPTGGVPVALEAGLIFRQTPGELGLASGDRITFTALFKATTPPLLIPTPTPTPKPKVVGVYGGNARMLHYQFPGLWDPHISGTIPVESLFFNQLVEYSPISPSEIIGDIAKSWKVSDDFLSYTFYIHENAKWHDGKELTAEDVVFSLNRIIEPGAPRPQAGQLRPYVKNAEVIDRNTVKVNLNFATGAFMAFLAVDVMAMVPKHVVEAGTDINEFENIVGSGPFIPGKIQRGSLWSGEKNLNYFKEGRPFFESVTWFNIGDPGTVAAAFRAGKFDLTSGYFNLGTDDVIALAPDLKGEYTVHYQPVNNWQIFFGNANKEPWTDPRVLRALRYATDLQEFLDAFGGGIWELGAPFPFESWYARSKEELLKLPGYGGVPGSPRTKQQDIDEAIALLKEAGFDPPSELGTRTILSGTVPIQLDPAVLWQTQMKRNLGIDIKVDAKEIGATRVDLRDGNFDLGSGGGGLMIFDPNDFLNAFYGPAGRNHSRGPKWTNQRFIDWIDQQAREPDVEKRKTLLRQMETYLLEEDSPYIPWTWTPLFFIASDKIKTEAGAFVVPPTIRINMKQEHVWLVP